MDAMTAAQSAGTLLTKRDFLRGKRTRIGLLLLTMARRDLTTQLSRAVQIRRVQHVHVREVTEMKTSPEHSANGKSQPAGS